MAQPHPSALADPAGECKGLLEDARRAFNEKNPEKVSALLEKAEKVQQNEPHLNYLMGVLFARINKTGPAIGAFKRAIKVRPACFDFYKALGAVLLKAKRIEEAEAVFKTATFLNPARAHPFLNLAIVSLALKNQHQARHAFKTFLGRAFIWPFKEVFRKSAEPAVFFAGVLKGIFVPGRKAGLEGVLARAALLTRFHEREKAFSLLDRAVKRTPDYSPLALALARQYIYFENSGEARTLLEKVHKKNPKELQVISLLVEVLAHQGRLQEARAYLDSVPEKLRSSPLYLKTLALTYYRSNEAEKALQNFEGASQKAGMAADFFNTYARALGSLGRLGEAEEKFRLAISADKAFPHAYTGLAKMGKLLPGDALFTQLLAEIENPNLPQKTRCFLNFSAGFAFEKAKQYDKAFKHFRDANALRDVTFSKEAWAEKGKDLRKVFTQAFIKQNRKQGNPSIVPIFIVGMPRSGTSLTQQILAAHTKVYGAGEREAINIIIHDYQKGLPDGPSWPLSAKSLGKKNIREMAENYLADYKSAAPEAKRVTDKMPGNFWELGLISILFPNAKIIHCTRDPMDTCLSNYFQAYFTFHPYAFSLENLGFYFKEYRKIMAHWHRVLPGKILDFNYEETISGPKPQIQKLLKFCGLPWEAGCLEFHKTEAAVQTASFAQVREPIYKTSAKKWQLYEAHLGPLKQALK